MDYKAMLDLSAPYLGTLVGVFTDWTPLAGRGSLYPDDVDATDPWQFRNFRVM